MDQEHLLKRFQGSLEPKLSSKMLDYYAEAKNEQMLSHWDTAITKYGKFLEFVAKGLYQKSTGDSNDRLLRDYTSSIRKQTSLPKAIRLYLTNAIEACYDIRNNRDAAHATLSVDPNLLDCAYVSATCDWILSELLIQYGDSDRASISEFLLSLTRRQMPFLYKTLDGTALLLIEDIPAGLESLSLLYLKKTPMNLDELCKSIPHHTRDNIRIQLNSARRRKQVFLAANGQYEILPPGVGAVEAFLKEKMSSPRSK